MLSNELVVEDVSSVEIKRVWVWGIMGRRPEGSASEVRYNSESLGISGRSKPLKIKIPWLDPFLVIVIPSRETNSDQQLLGGQSAFTLIGRIESYLAQPLLELWVVDELLVQFGVV